MPVKVINKFEKRRLQILRPHPQPKDSPSNINTGSNTPKRERKISGINEKGRENNPVRREQLYRDADRYRIIFEATFEGIVIHQNGLILDVNPAFENKFGYSRDELLGRPVLIIAAPNSYDLMARKIKSSYQKPYEAIGIRKDGSNLVLEINAKEHEYNGNKIRVAAIRDITSHRRIEEALKGAYERLEAEQTALREKNTALKELMSQIEGEKANIRKRIQTNVDRILLPILKKLQAHLGGEERIYLTLLENTLNEIAAPFVNQLERFFAVLTPREVEICNMIKNGYSSKDIAASLHTSAQTVLKQRKAIRRKMGIANQDINLVTFLKAL
jgi:PAS domain S-box-containing protein